jgi:hypothetical protein
VHAAWGEAQLDSDTAQAKQLVAINSDTFDFCTLLSARAQVNPYKTRKQAQVNRLPINSGSEVQADKSAAAQMAKKRAKVLEWKKSKLSLGASGKRRSAAQNNGDLRPAAAGAQSAFTAKMGRAIGSHACTPPRATHTDKPPCALSYTIRAGVSHHSCLPCNRSCIKSVNKLRPQ